MRKLLLGLAAGLSFGMLFAPEKGRDTRKKLAKSDTKMADVINLFKTAGNDASEEVKAFIESDEIKELLAKGNSGLDEIVNKGKKLSDSGKTELANVFETVSKKLSENVDAVKEVTSKITNKVKEKKKGFFS